jgi:hypothetical protein
MPGADPVLPPVLKPTPILAYAAIGAAFFGNLFVWALPLLVRTRSFSAKAGISIAFGASCVCLILCAAALVLSCLSLVKRQGAAVLSIVAFLLGLAGALFGGFLLAAAIVEGGRYF